jgi:hypothetical protein
MVDEELKDQLKAITTALREVVSIYGQSNSLWYGRMLTNVLVLTDLDPILYATAAFDHKAKTAKAIVLTDSLIVTANVNDLEDLESQRATAHSRKAIRAISVGSGEGVFSTAVFSDWPGELAIEITIEGLDSPLQIPLEHKMNGDPSAEMRKIVASLTADLR